MYKVNDKLYIREANITHIKFYEGQEAFIGVSSGLNLSCTDEEGRALLEHLNGLYNDVPTPPAADQDDDDFDDDDDWDDDDPPAAIGLMVMMTDDGEPMMRILFDDDDDEKAGGAHLLGPDGDYGNYMDDKNADPVEIDPFVALVKSGDFVILDTETTGLDDRAEICQIAIIDSSGDVLVDTLVKPRRAIPSTATAIHGITNDMVGDAPSWLNVNERVWQAMHGKTVIVYNAEYDFRLLAQSELACEPAAVTDWYTIKRACAMLKFAEIYGDWDSYRQSWKWQKLDTAARHYLISTTHAHSALGDCLTTLAVVKAIANKSSTSE